MTTVSTPPRSKPTARDLSRIAFILWTIILLAIAGRVLARPQKTVYLLFHQTGQHWLHSDVIYKKGEYRYSPLVAAMLVPLGMLPLRVSSLIWLALNAVVFFWGFRYWTRIALPNDRPPWIAPAILLLATPILVGNFSNLQSNPMVLGLMLGAIAGALDKRWNLVTLCILIATLLKIYPLALGLVLLVQYPRQLTWRLLVALAISAVLPFAFQRFDYVADCYRQWLWVLQHDDRTEFGPYLSYKTVDMLWRTWIGPTNPTLYKSIQMTAAAIVGAAALFLRRAPQPHRLMILLGSVLLWILIFGPATESATHMLVGPLLGWMILESLLAPWPRILTILLFLAYALLVFTSFALTMPWGRFIVTQGTQPAAELLVAICFIAWSISVKRLPAATPLPAHPPQNA